LIPVIIITTYSFDEIKIQKTFKKFQTIYGERCSELAAESNFCWHGRAGAGVPHNKN
jgi:hypothetical protein